MAIFHGAVIFVALVIWLLARIMFGRGVRFWAVLHVVLGAAVGAVAFPIMTYLAIAPFVALQEPATFTRVALPAMVVAMPLGAGAGAWAAIWLVKRLDRRRRL